MTFGITLHRIFPKLSKTLAGLGAATLLGFASSAAMANEHEAALYAEWARTAPVAEFEQYLREANLGNVIPTQQLARTASDWKRCAGPRFELPPKHLWPEVRKVVGLVAELKKRGIFQEVEAVSNYRNPKLNACAGGAKHSAHTSSFAVDIVPGATVNAFKLCNFWRTQGKTWKMGLSRYPSGRIHLDTSGYRTWGASHGKASSVCS
jgi:hypothetical protein